MPHLVYILASKRDGVLYTGATSDLAGRVVAHREKAVRGFTARYGVDRLVWCEVHETLESALDRKERSSAGAALGRSL